MRLNLGCGKIILPTSKDNAANWHLSSVFPDSVETEEWVNVDKVALPGVDEVINLFVYPWIRSTNGNPFNDNSVDEIWCSHLVEHIPHDPIWARGAEFFPLLRESGAIDGWYAFFYEAWRILKPGAIMHVVAPYAFNRAGVADPTHRRYIVPNSFGYLSPNPDAPFDYGLPYAFRALDDARLSTSNGVLEEAQFMTQHSLSRYLSEGTNRIEGMYIALAAVKDH